MNKKIIFLLLFFWVITLFGKLPQTQAANFTNAYLRLSHQTPNSTLLGTVCAQASSAGAGVENKVIIQFPADFTVSGNATNWTTTVTNLPAGSTPWPGIGNPATNVSGQSVTFSSNDLTANTLYCFNFNGAASTTGAAGNDKSGTLTTKNASNTTIDQTAYAISLTANNQIQVTASVPPQISDLPIAIESETAGSNFPENTVLDYKITYGLLAAGSFPVTIQAQWSKGTITGSPTPSVDLLDYIIGSASNAYGSTPAVVDTINRTITWTIPSFPGNTVGQIVTFELKTNNFYMGTNVVSFDVSGRNISGSTVTPDQTVNQTYLYNSGLEPTPTSGPTATPGPSTSNSNPTTATPTPTETPTPSLTFTTVSLQSLSTNQAQIYVLTNNNSAVTVQYGTSLKSLSQSITTSLPTTESLLTLTDLLPNTDYYYRVTAKDAYGNIIKSDIFTFTTAVASEAPSANLQSLIVTSNNNILLNPLSEKIITGNSGYSLIIPQSSIFEIHFSLQKFTQIKSIQLIVRNKNVLGDNTFTPSDASSNFVDLVETQPGVYTGRLLSQQTPGVYELYAKIIDFNGNITFQKIAEIVVVAKFKVVEKGTNNPIENARVLFYLYNPTTKIYDIISPEILPINNPSFSQPDGIVPIVLPSGRYKANISAISYDSKSVEFEVGAKYGNYPTVYLQTQAFSLSNYIDFFGTTFSDYVTSSERYLSEISASSRLFALLESLTLLGFVSLAFLSFSAKTHIPLLYIPYFFFHKLKQIFFKENSLTIGKVYDDVNEVPVSKALVSIIDAKKNNLLAHLKTNRLGEFYYKKLVDVDKIKISVMREGFMPSPALEFSKKALSEMPIIINIEKDNAYQRSILKTIALTFENILGAFGEFLLVLAIILEIYFIPPLGIVRVLPFLILSIFNVVLLIFYLYKPRSLVFNSPLVKAAV
jgi:hypothetical protein